jgi:ribosome-binding protein aMBF1 (putative translation factor)
MKANKRRKLEDAGWKVGSSQDFLGLTDEEIEFIEMKLALSNKVREQRAKKGLSQTELAKLLGSSQSRVAKMESGDASVSVDLLLKALLALGVPRKKVAQVLAA